MKKLFFFLFLLTAVKVNAQNSGLHRLANSAMNLDKGDVLSIIAEDDHIDLRCGTKNIKLRWEPTSIFFYVSKEQYNLLTVALKNTSVQVLLNSQSQMVGYAEMAPEPFSTAKIQKLNNNKPADLVGDSAMLAGILYLGATPDSVQWTPKNEIFLFFNEYKMTLIPQDYILYLEHIKEMADRKRARTKKQD